MNWLHPERPHLEPADFIPPHEHRYRPVACTHPPTMPLSAPRDETHVVFTCACLKPSGGIIVETFSGRFELEDITGKAADDGS
jgi:hypothetical protein